MDPCVSTESTQVLRAAAGPCAGSNNTRDNCENLQQDVDIFNTSIKNCFGPVETSKPERGILNSNPAIHNPGDAVGPKSSPTGISPDCLPNFDLGTPLVLSPTETVSAASSPGAGNDIWDSPETPSHRLIGKPGTEVFTPLTPPTTYGVSVEQTPSLTAPKSLFAAVIKDASIFGKEAARITRSGDEDEWKEHIPSGDYFHPKRLNLTKDFQAIGEANARAGRANYNLNPSFNFSLSAYDTPSQKHPKSKIPDSSKVGDATSQVKVESTEEKVEAKNIPRARKSRTDLQVVLEHIVPSSIHTRLRNKTDQCVASIVKKPDARCTNNAQGPLDIVNETFQNISTCIKETNYTALLEQIERLVHAAMCGSHQIAALTGPKSDPRMAKLKGLVSNLMHISNEDRSKFVTWINAIANINLPPGEQNATNDDLSIKIEPATSKSYTARKTPALPSTGNATATDVTATLSYAPTFRPYLPKCTAKLSVSEALRSRITEPLNITDLKDGFIYIFWDKENFGKVKIGRTDNIDRRLKEWSRKCKHTYSYHRPSKTGEFAEIPHVSRVERLIHIELKEHREQRACKACGETHKEWFDIREEAHVVKIFQKWQKWITQKPYALDRESGKWKLRPEMLDTLPEVCEPVPLELTQQTPRPRSGGVKPKRGVNTKGGRRYIR
ncbi:DUF1766-domain-containing protein [Melanomma pulvis-pyrius CBS 109.77]|uniref:DUF1766-domain-containing protein n=1 Tax=Melanomma pulvis-pyrius CBS 109.77 TaxID=1314802 RepID=A0A6A6XG80_9PLEO|nr:DUF1766-domain-containing protein [Melanomma pulvis-pyrius CBS 109.77]